MWGRQQPTAIPDGLCSRTVSPTVFLLFFSISESLDRLTFKHYQPSPCLSLNSFGAPLFSFFHRPQAQTLSTFQPYSKYPPCYKDVTFWLPEENFHNNDLFEVVRDVAGDLVEEVTYFLGTCKKQKNIYMFTL